MKQREWIACVITATAIFYFGPYLALYFVAWDLWWPFQTALSRIGLVLAVFFAVGFTKDISDKMAQKD